MNNQLILRASRKNRDEIKQALAALDTPARQLVIRVTQNRDAVMNRSGAEPSAASATIMCASPSRRRASQPVAARWSSAERFGRRRTGGGNRSTRTASAAQSVQVVEGGRAFINVGQSIPLPMQQVVLGPGGAIVTNTTVYRDIGQGSTPSRGWPVTVSCWKSARSSTRRQCRLRQRQYAARLDFRLRPPRRMDGAWRQRATGSWVRIAAIFPSAPPTCATTAASGCWSRK